jgi:xanthine/CO dehydrogenase XdhC/CoxF family maturation factor
LGIPALLKFLSRHEGENSLVLATIIATQGSTYRKPGAMMLISSDGSFEGLISGGCLEGDLLQHAARVFEDGKPHYVTYDMHADEELVWNLGLGCNGVIHLLLQRLERGSDFGFFGALKAAHGERRPVVLGLLTGSDERSDIGGFVLFDNADISIGDPELLDFVRGCTQPWPAWRTRSVHLPGTRAEREMLVIHMPVQPRVLICGAGPDALPLARMLSELDWNVTLVDHRPAYARQERFPASCRLLKCRPTSLEQKLELKQLDAAVIMSHHLGNDAEYLKQLARHDLPYLGVLGPCARRDRLKQMSGCPDQVIYGPVGLDIGAELPEAIALSITAEIHAVLNERDGHSLTGLSNE